MRVRRVLSSLLVLAVFPTFVSGQGAPPSDPQASAFASQSIAALTGGISISDVTLTASVTWTGTDTGGATLKAFGNGESRMDLALSSGNRSEVRDAQTGTSLGQWFAPDGSSGYFAFQNCFTDAVWFFPALGSLAGGTNVVLTYIGQETRSGESVQHVQSYVYQPNPLGVAPSPQQMSTMDFYLDAATLLPAAIAFNAYSDSDATTDLLSEIDFSNYQSIGNVVVPMHIQKFQQGNLMIDLSILGASFNTGLSLSNFTIN